MVAFSLGLACAILLKCYHKEEIENPDKWRTRNGEFRINNEPMLKVTW